MKKKKAVINDVDCEFKVSQDGKSVTIEIQSNVPIFAHHYGAQVIVDSVADSAMHYYSISADEWEAMSVKEGLDS